MDSSLPEHVCPLESRRPLSGIYLRLVISHCTILVALYHLARIRKEPFPGFQIFAVTVSPLSIVLRWVSTLVYIFATATQRHDRSPQGKQKAGRFVAEHLALLLFTEVKQNAYGSRMLSSANPTWSSRSSRSRTFAWQTSLMLVLTFKSLATMFLYARRKANAATTHADEKLMELACAELLIAALTLCVMFSWPQFLATESPPSKETIQTHIFEDPMASASTTKSSTYNSVDVVLAIGRDMWTPDFYRPREENPWLVWQLYASGIFPYLSQLSLSLVSHFPYTLFFMTTCEETCAPMKELLFAWTLISLVGGVPIGLLMPFLVVPRSLRHSYLTFTIWVFIFVFCTPILLPMVFGMFYAPFVFFQEYARIGSQVQSLRQWPPDKPCPLLWHDPVAMLFGWML